MRAAFHSVNDLALTPYVDRVVDGPILASEPQRGEIARIDSLGRFDAVSYTLSNGIKGTGSPLIGDSRTRCSSGALSPGGLSMQYADSIVPSLKMLEEVIPISAYGRFSANDLKRRLTGKDLKVSVEIKETEEKVEASATTATLADAFRPHVPAYDRHPSRPCKAL